MATSPSRRAVLAAAAALVTSGLAGCATPWGRLRVQPLGGDPPPVPPEPGPDELARRAAVAAVQAVASALDAGLLEAGRAALLGGVLAEQLSALGESATPTATPSATPTGTTAAASTTTTAPDPAVVADLLRRTATTAQERLADVAAGSARLLACLAAGSDVAADWVAQAAPTSAPVPATAPASSSGAAASPTAPAGTGVQAALVAALGVEEAAEYGYGVVAARLQGEQRARAVADLAAHTAAADALRAELLGLGAQPPTPAPAWSLPSPVGDAAAAAALAEQLERGSAGAAADVVLAADRGRRAAAAAEVLASARRGQGWRDPASAPVALPGLSGR